MRSTVALAAIDDAVVRCGPYMRLPGEFRQEFRINNPFGTRTGWCMNGGYGVDEFGAWRRNMSGQITPHHPRQR